MTMKRVERPAEESAVPVMNPSGLPNDYKKALKFGPVGSDEELSQVAHLRSISDPWRSRSETLEQSVDAMTKLRPFVRVAKLENQLVGYVTIERDGPVPGAAYMRNIVVRPELRRKGIGNLLLNHAIETAKDMYRKTLALRVDPANGPAVSFYRNSGFTTVATVVSKKSGKLRLLMSREL
ncbi:MAG: GNAT family N-acetyltransferase [Myxococcaceae bacterium]